MWGFISTEACYQSNFNTSFSTTRSDVLIHLAQWQYWWWFWFAFLWSFYYLIISKIIRFRSLKMKPKISTSFRPHGKWGDFLAAIVPLIWCMNILANSNFILRLIEWQNETNIFTIRVRARQWYWVYKIDLKNFFSVLNINKNVGRNKWFDNNNINDFLILKNVSILNKKNYNKNLSTYWNELNLKFNSFSKSNFLINIENKQKNKQNLNYNNLEKHINYFYIIKNKYFEKSILDALFFNNKNNYILKLRNKPKLNFFLITNSKKLKQISYHYYDFLENSRFLKTTFGQKLPLRLMKQNTILIKNKNLFHLKFNNEENYFKNKDQFTTNFLILKQKKYTKKNNLILFSKDNIKNLFYLVNNKIFLEAKNEIINYYKLIKKNKNHSDIFMSALNKRLLRTKKTLTIPAHINLSIITSSFDIIHSWFIPGLGLKLDCVPGRSTHHTFYIDSVGFYYGQCAEICGRYHHHMPIRLCALPFEHFLIWWQNFGLVKVSNLSFKKNNSTIFFFRKFCW